MPKATKASHFALQQALEMGPPPLGNLATPVFSHGSLQAELYEPVGTDPQTPHSRDEIYVVATGSADFFNGQEHVQVTAGSFLFVPAGVEHRFENMSAGFAVWVFFYGPEGGERDDG